MHLLGKVEKLIKFDNNIKAFYSVISLTVLDDTYLSPHILISNENHHRRTKLFKHVRLGTKAKAHSCVLITLQNEQFRILRE